MRCGAQVPFFSVELRVAPSAVVGETVQATWIIRNLTKKFQKLDVRCSLALCHAAPLRFVLTSLRPAGTVRHACVGIILQAECHGGAEDFLWTGVKKGRIQVNPSSTAHFATSLVPLRPGRLPLPQVPCHSSLLRLPPACRHVQVCFGVCSGVTMFFWARRSKSRLLGWMPSSSRRQRRRLTSYSSFRSNRDTRQGKLKQAVEDTHRRYVMSN